MKKKSILNANSHLQSFLREGEEFYIGLLYEDFSEFLDFKKYGFPENFEEGYSILPKGLGPKTKANIDGKYVRKKPDEKTSKYIHIQYTKNGRLISFTREYYVYIKELLHKYNITLSYYVNKHGQRVVVSNKLIFNTDYHSNLKNTHVINVFCEIFNDFEVFNSEFEPAINFNRRFESELLPKGKLDARNFEEVIEISKHYTRNETEHKAFQKRLHILKKYDPDVRGKGLNGFMGYIVFGFSDLNLVILESMYSDNATYIFSMEDYENNIILDKQQVKENKFLLKKVYHYENWEEIINSFFQKRIDYGTKKFN